MIVTERLVLRPFAEADRSAFRAVLADPATMQPWGGPYDQERADEEFDGYLEHARQHGYAPFAVVLDGELIGDMGLQHLEDGPEVEIVYRLLPRAWGQGYGAEAGAAALRYAVDVLRLQTVIAVIAEDNTASRALARRLGFVPVSTGSYYGKRLLRHEVTAEQVVRPTTG